MAQEVFEKWGFGLAPPKTALGLQRRKSAEQLLKILERREELIGSKIVLDAISEVKGLFNRVVRQDQWDWFSVARQLGCPSTRISEAIALSLANLRSAVRDNDEKITAESLSSLRRLPTRKCLKVFVGKAEIANEDNAGWVYILSTREIPNLLKIGMTARTVEERAREINAATGVAIPFGVRCCWRVRDPARAEMLVHAALDHARVRGDREFFRIQFSDAKKTIIDELVKHSLEIRTLDNLFALAEDGH
jgi:hypothetical protein